MPSAKELPGLYFDPEKNRYFPIKGPIPGLKRPSCSSISDESSDKNKKHQIDKARRRDIMKPLELLQFRELLGTNIMSNGRRYKFKQEYEKLQASHPQVWKYQRTNRAADGALEQMHCILRTPEGLKESSVLLAGSLTGSFRLYAVGSVGQCFNPSSRRIPEPVCPDGTKCESRDNTSLGGIWSAPEVSRSFSSDVSCVRKIGKRCPDLADDASSSQRALITTLGSGASGGSVYILNLTEPLDFRSSPIHPDPRFFPDPRFLNVGSFNCTIWAADCSWNGTHAVIGTNLGVALINLETTVGSWVYRGKSDVFSQQFDHSGNVVLCGLRNGAIIEVDVRQRRSRSATPPIVQRRNYTSLVRHGRMSKQRFETKKKQTSFNHLLMPSAVCSLVKLQSDENYILGSSMDGSIMLFDRRLLGREAIQSYEGHVNSHSHLQLGVNPSETLVLSGGEDRYARIWSINTGELICEEKFSNSIPSAVCWPQEVRGLLRPTRNFEECALGLNHSWGAWLGSRDGLFYMHGT